MKVLLLAISLICCVRLSAQDTLTVMAYNILNFPTSNPSKADTLKPIIKHVQPDIFMITELTSGSGVATILNNSLNVDGVNNYQSATYVNGPDTDNMLFYNSDKLTLYSQYEIPTTLRNISEYVLYYNAPNMTSLSDTVFIYCYMAHLKASSGSTNEQQRNQEAVAMKNYMDSRLNIENIIVGGDFNLYTSAEAAHNTILNGGNVSLIDPINTPGNWNNNSFYANVHTQSTRSGSIGDGGAFGGMDDRFDFIFYNNDLPTGSKGLTYVPNSYTALGNDGNHFNKSINASPTNTSAPSNVIDALYYMSDHLPITIKAFVDANVGVENIKDPTAWNGHFANQQFYFSSDKIEKNIEIDVFDVLGKRLLTASFSNKQFANIHLYKMNKGIYFVRVNAGTKQKSFKFFNK